MLKIISVEHNSVGEEIGLEAGDVVKAFDGCDAVDVLDYEYFEGQEKFVLTVLAKGGEQVDVEIEKDEDESLGLTFEDKCYLTPRACRNKCIFCFVDQLPKGMRRSLYVKDDDWRLSFAAGNYVTFTNLAESEIKRIIDKKFSPLYVSVHATDDAVRRNMLQNQTAAPIIPLMKRFAENGVVMHAQIVLCPDVNDGEILKKSLQELFALYPKVATVAVVPVGLTKHRQGLSFVKSVDKKTANDVIDMTEAFAAKCFEKTGSRFAYCSDEFYILAERTLPPYEYYEDFAQIENGVGLLAKYRRDFDENVDGFSRAKKESFCIVTGEAACDFMSEIADELRARFGAKCTVVKVKNDFFGHSVTVSGLLTAQDILKNVASCGKNDVLLLPASALKETQDVFLDGMTLKEFKEKSGRKVVTVKNAYDLLNAVLEGEV